MTQQIQCDVCIVGAGPAGMMAAVKLTHYGLKVVLLERSPSFPAAREFRGESISQQSIAIFDNLGVLQELARYDYLKTEQMQVVQGEKLLLQLDFTTLPFQHKCPIDIPQPLLLAELLKLIENRGNFTFLKGANCKGLLEEGDVIVGVQVSTPDGPLNVRSRLVIGADGRYTKTRKMAGLDAIVTPADRDVIWFKVPRPMQWGNVGSIHMMNGDSLIVLPTYPDLLRVGLSIPSGSFRQWRASGLPAFYAKVDALHRELGLLAREHVRDANALSLLDIFTAQVPVWYRRGFVLIGDAAHTLSPILGQGVNQGILDAVYLAPMVFHALNENDDLIGEEVLKDFQTQREGRIRFVHGFQARQEWMIGLAGWYSNPLRSVFYRLVGLLPPLRGVLASKLYYSHAVEQHLQRSESAVLAKLTPKETSHA